jgi:hypothetical protein
MTALASKAGAGGIDTVALATYLAREKMIGAESRFRPFIEVCPWRLLHSFCGFFYIFVYISNIYFTEIYLKHILYYYTEVCPCDWLHPLLWTLLHFTIL